MKRVGAVLTVAGAMAVGLSAGTASADVHGVSKAECAPTGVLSGAIQSGEEGVDAPGRPAAPIPVSASPFSLATFPGKGNDAPAQGTFCFDPVP
jgi:hypothetical protein